MAISAPVLAAPVSGMASRQAGWPAANVIWACAYLAFGSMFLGFFA